MKPILLLYILNAIGLCFPLVKQFIIIVRSPENDPHITSKVVFFIATIALMIGMWACYFEVREVGWIFFLVIIGISIWTYTRKPKNE